MCCIYELTPLDASRGVEHKSVYAAANGDVHISSAVVLQVVQRVLAANNHLCNKTLCMLK